LSARFADSAEARSLKEQGYDAYDSELGQVLIPWGVTTMDTVTFGLFHFLGFKRITMSGLRPNP